MSSHEEPDLLRARIPDGSRETEARRVSRSLSDELGALLDDRIGAGSIIRAVLAYPVRGGASLGHSLGIALVALFLVQCVTGALLAAYYSPSVTNAWASVAYIERVVDGGAVIRGIHHFGTGAMVILAGLHAMLVVLRGAYKAPREPNWWVGLALLALVLAYPLTGYTLLWDQLGYWASKVRSGITASVPLLGPWLEDLAIGGNDHGNLTLTRSYALHVVVLPALTTALIVLHVVLFARKGYTPPEGAKARAVEPYGLRQIAYDLSLASLGVGAVAVLGATFGAPLEAPAEATESFIARPEWYFLPLFQLLKYFDGPLQVLGTVVVPGLVAAFLFSLPLLDRGPSRSVRTRWPWVGGFFVLLVGMASLAGLAIRSDLGDASLADHRAFSARESARALELAEAGVPPEGAALMMARDPLVRGARLFRKRCRSCHALEGFVPAEPKGPDLTAYRSKAWLRALIRDPSSPRFFGLTEDIDGMPAFDDLTDSELDALVDLIYGLRDAEGIDIEAHPQSALATEKECVDCHDFEDRFALEGPSLVAYLSPAWIRAMIDDPSASHLYGEMNEMPAFEARLSEVDRDALVAFLLSLEDRASRGRWPYVDEDLSAWPARRHASKGALPEEEARASDNGALGGSLPSE